MDERINVDGVITDLASARVPVLDRGFLYGDGVYEVYCTAGGRGVDLDPHLARLERSATRIGLPVPPRAALIAAIDATLAAAGVRVGGPEDAYVRVIVTRGDGEFGLDPALSTRPRVVVIVRRLARPSAAAFEAGVSVRIVSVQRNSARALDPAIKSGNYLNNILGLAEARRDGAYEAVLCDADGRIAEGASSNIYLVRGGTVRTPGTSIGMLPGITRWRLLQLAAAEGVAVEEVDVRPDELRGADEAFLTSSIRGVLPISRVDDQALPVGPVTRRLIALYEGFLQRVAAGA